jgi:hypothetical protein
MPRPFKLYSWTGFHPDSPDRHRQCRFAIAAHSKVEARRLAGHFASRGVVMAIGEPDPDSPPAIHPGVLFWTTLLPESDPCPACGGRGRLPRPDPWRMVIGEGAVKEGAKTDAPA